MGPKEGSALGPGEDATGVTSGAASMQALEAAADGYLWERKELHSTSNLSSHGTGVMRQGTAAEQGDRSVTSCCKGL